MRITQVYILRLLVDDQFPDHLQGAISPVKGVRQSYPFCSDAALLDLLHHLNLATASVPTGAAAEPTCAETESERTPQQTNNRSDHR